jgi:hypothetical protein
VHFNDKKSKEGKNCLKEPKISSAKPTRSATVRIPPTTTAVKQQEG